MPVWMEIALIVLLLVANGAFALAEIAMVSSRKARLQALAARGQRSAATALRLMEQPERFLSAVQVGITAVGILAGAFGGAALGDDLAPLLQPLPGLGAYANEIAFAAIVVAITYLSLVVGELLPKRLGLRDAEWWACAMAPPMELVARVATPIVWLLGQSTNAAFALLGMKDSAEPTVTEDEVNILVQQGTRSGVFHTSEGDIVARVLRLGDRTVRSLMTPRPEVVWVRRGDAPEAALARMVEAGHSHYPYCGSSLDDVIGIIPLKAVWRHLHQRETARDAGGAHNLEVIVQQPLLVDENLKAADLLDRFREARTHAALVVDAYGGLAGVVTNHDLLEAMVGTIPDQNDEAEAAFAQRADGSWLIAGWAPIDDVGRTLGEPTLAESTDYHTMAGLVLHLAGHIPRVGESFTWRAWTFEVVDVDRHRVDQVLATRKTDSSAGE